MLPRPTPVSQPLSFTQKLLFLLLFVGKLTSFRQKKQQDDNAEHKKFVDPAQA